MFSALLTNRDVDLSPCIMFIPVCRLMATYPLSFHDLFSAIDFLGTTEYFEMCVAEEVVKEF